MSEADLDPVIHQITRLQILAYLHRNRVVAFTTLRDALGLTAGNLQSHATRLEAAGYLVRRSVLRGVNFEQRFVITPEGSKAFKRYVREIQRVLESAGTFATHNAPGPPTDTPSSQP